MIDNSHGGSHLAPANRDVARFLRHLADLLEISGEGAGRAAAFRRAAQAIDELAIPIDTVVRSGGLQSIRGVGPAIAAVIDQFVTTGGSDLLEDLRRRVPEPVLEMLRIPGLGPRTIHTLITALGIENIDQLQEAAEQGRIRRLPGFGPKREENILRAVTGYRRRTARELYARAEVLADELVAGLAQAAAVRQVTYAGSLRRRAATVGNINLVAAVPLITAAEDVFAALARMPVVTRVLQQTETMSVAELVTGLQCQLLVTSESAFAAALQYFTGSILHNEQLQELMLARGQSLYRWSERWADPAPLAVTDEHEIYHALGLQFIPPELREGSGEIEAAMAGELPDLVQLTDIRGDLHLHTSWSDGRQTIEEMRTAAAAQGYEYVAITDHSVSLAIARGLQPGRLLDQAHAIRQLRSDANGPYLLSGTEVDILADGSLDYDDDVLAALDLVVASVHSRFNMTERDMTRRIIKAMENPHVDILAHPTGRVLGWRDGYQVDVEAVLQAAVRTGTVVEINASPERLDLPDRWVRRAVELGVPLAINSDAHGVDGLKAMRYGVYTARRGWAPAGQIINTWPLERLLAFLSLDKGERLRKGF